MKTIFTLSSLLFFGGLTYTQDAKLATGIYYCGCEGDSTLALMDYSETIHVCPTPIVTAKDFATVATVSDYAKRWTVEIQMKEYAIETLKAATIVWHSKKFTVIVNGKVIQSPVVNKTIIDGKYWINGLSGKGEASKLKGEIESEM